VQQIICNLAFLVLSSGYNNNEEQCLVSHCLKHYIFSELSASQFKSMKLFACLTNLRLYMYICVYMFQFLILCRVVLCRTEHDLLNYFEIRVGMNHEKNSMNHMLPCTLERSKG
jgi:hypothetical protein